MYIEVASAASKMVYMFVSFVDIGIATKLKTSTATDRIEKSLFELSSHALLHCNQTVTKFHDDDSTAWRFRRDKLASVAHNGPK